MFRSRAAKRSLKYFVVIGVVLFATHLLITSPDKISEERVASKDEQHHDEQPVHSKIKSPLEFHEDTENVGKKHHKNKNHDKHHVEKVEHYKQEDPSPEYENDNILVDNPDDNNHPVLNMEGESQEIDVDVFPRFAGHSVTGNKEPELGAAKLMIGERGDPVVLDESLNSQVKASISEWGFNMVASDKVSLDREPKDLRHEECKHWDYPPEDMMPTVSIVLVFHNEAWSTLMRTVHSVYNRTPAKILKEVVLIDDGSNKPHLAEQLEEYIKGKFEGKAKLYRNGERHGLIRARCDGARKATGDILVYLDAHCEAGYNWIYPLITPIMKDRRTCTCPLVDVIDGNKYTFTEQAGGDENGHARGAWDWDLLWKRVPLTHREKAKHKYMSEPYASPAMAGGLFAINRDYFFEIGLYDEELEIWGGENFEISYKLWQCGGSLMFVPCSRVGHVYRLPGWRGNPAPKTVHANFAMRNYVRVVTIWWGDYAKYFFERRPEARHVDPGDLTKQRKLFADLKCKSFEWFMEEVAYDIPKRFPLVIPDNGAEGHLSLEADANWCLDGKHAGQGVAIGLAECSRGGDTNFMLSWHEDIRQGRGKNEINKHKMCLDCIGKNSKVTMWECHGQGGNQLWKYDEDTFTVRHALSGGCLTGDISTSKVDVKDCRGTPEQRWHWAHTNSTQLKMFNKDPRNAVLVKEIDEI